MEEASGGQAELGQTYLPGTASLVQEIDSESHQPLFFQNVAGRCTDQEAVDL